jgi:hypothetical protein
MTEPSGIEAAADDYERRIREKVWATRCLTNGEWVYLVGLFQTARDHDECAALRPAASGAGPVCCYCDNVCIVVCGHCGREQPDDSASLPCLDEEAIRSNERERCANLIETMQETNTETKNGTERHLTQRMNGNLLGLAFAAAIRSLKIGSGE